jgi:hypothetical protein
MSSKGRRRDATARAGECERCALMWDDHYMMPPVPVDDVKCASLTFRLGVGLSTDRVQDVHPFDNVRKHRGGQGYWRVPGSGAEAFNRFDGASCQIRGWASCQIKG